MPLPAFATLADVEERDSRYDPGEVLAVLRSASSAIRGVTRRSWVDDDGELVAMPDAAREVLRIVALECALRVLRNPEGALTRTESLGPASETITIDPNLYFSKLEREQLEWATLQAYPSLGFAGLATIATTRGPIETSPLLNGDLGIDAPEEDIAALRSLL